MIDLDAIAEKWLKLCGYCDAGLPMGCTCTGDDPRSDIQRLAHFIRAQQDQIEQQNQELNQQAGIIVRQRVTIAEQGDKVKELRDQVAFLNEEVADLHRQLAE
jgi:septal ring factor EnvC (AmiA/AmiB activator)